MLIEHHWAVPLRDAVLSPLDLIGVGLVSAAEAAQMHGLETASVWA